MSESVSHGTIAAGATGAFQSWAILELMGHRQRYGYVQEVELAGGKMLRIDIPAAGPGGDITEFYGVASVYALRPCSEEICRDQLKRYGDPRPARPVEYRIEDRAADRNEVEDGEEGR